MRQSGGHTFHVLGWPCGPLLPDHSPSHVHGLLTPKPCTTGVQAGVPYFPPAGSAAPTKPSLEKQWFFVSPVDFLDC